MGRCSTCGIDASAAAISTAWLKEFFPCGQARALTAPLPPLLNTRGDRSGRMPSQPEKACFSNSNKNFAPSASVPGHATHSILPGCLFSKAWGVANHQKQHISPQSASPSRPHLGSHPHAGRSGRPSQACSPQGNPTPAGEASLPAMISLLPSPPQNTCLLCPHQETLRGRWQNQVIPGDCVVLCGVRRLGLRDGTAATSG